MLEQAQSRPKILRRKQVQEVTGLSRSTIYLRISQGSFPKAISLGVRAVGWLESEIEAWLNARVELSRS
jgi:prophage regulatory protein